MLLNDREFGQLSEFIHSHLGIKMPPAKRTMLSGRLHKRLRALSMGSYADYEKYLFSPEGQGKELAQLYDVVTTNKTDFFRESSHFDFLTENVLPELLAGGLDRLRVWSAGCSSGEEPYTLAMVLSEALEKWKRLHFEIIATDISSKVLDLARRAIYREDRVAPVPLPLRRKYLLRSKDRQAQLVRVAPEVRKRVRFGRLNFMDADFGWREPMHVIFCRNVIIYFEKKTQEELMRKFCRHLCPGGYLFLGHSESLHGFDLPLEQVAPTVYRRK